VGRRRRSSFVVALSVGSGVARRSDGRLLTGVRRRAVLDACRRLSLSNSECDGDSSFAGRMRAISSESGECVRVCDGRKHFGTAPGFRFQAWIFQEADEGLWIVPALTSTSRPVSACASNSRGEVHEGDGHADRGRLVIRTGPAAMR